MLQGQFTDNGSSYADVVCGMNTPAGLCCLMDQAYLVRCMLIFWWLAHHFQLEFSLKQAAVDDSVRVHKPSANKHRCLACHVIHTSLINLHTVCSSAKSFAVQLLLFCIFCIFKRHLLSMHLAASVAQKANRQ